MSKTVFDIDDNAYVLKDVVGEGGQGVVFHVVGNKSLAIKGISDGADSIKADPEGYDSYMAKLRRVMALDDGDNSHITSPMALLKKPFCGYVMRFMEDMVPFEGLLKMPLGKKDVLGFIKETGGFKRRLIILRKLAELMSSLAGKSLVYSDLSPKNVFISSDVKSTEVWLIDADNLHYSGEKSSSVGSPYYRAPEVYVGKPNTLQSDEYSFALMVYRTLTMSSAFDGAGANEEDDWGGEETTDPLEKMESGSLAWCGSKSDPSNPQTAGIPVSLAFSDEIYELLRRTFEEGLHNPLKRPSMFEWASALKTSISNCVEYPYTKTNEDESQKDEHRWFYGNSKDKKPAIDALLFTSKRIERISHMDDDGFDEYVVPEPEKTRTFEKGADIIKLPKSIFFDETSEGADWEIEFSIIQGGSAYHGTVLDQTKIAVLKDGQQADLRYIKSLDNLTVIQYENGKKVRECEFKLLEARD